MVMAFYPLPQRDRNYCPPVLPSSFILEIFDINTCSEKQPASTVEHFQTHLHGQFPFSPMNWPTQPKGVVPSCAAPLGIRPMFAGGIRTSFPCEQQLDAMGV